MAYNITAELEAHVVSAFDDARVGEAVRKLSKVAKGGLSAGEEKHAKGTLQHLKVAHKAAAFNAGSMKGSAFFSKKNLLGGSKKNLLGSQKNLLR